MNENETQLHTILKVLDNEGILKNMILIGSWCLLFYKYIFNGFKPTIRTTDVDFYVPNAKEIKGNVIKALKDINYDLINDTLTQKSTFISPDGFELEFLVKLNRERLSCVKLGKTGIFAEALPYVEVFSGNYIEIEFNNIILKIASPSSYVVQKLLILNNRKEKKMKDISSIKEILSFIKASNKYKEELALLYDSLPNKWKRLIKKNALENNINMFEKEENNEKL